MDEKNIQAQLPEENLEQVAGGSTLFPGRTPVAECGPHGVEVYYPEPRPFYCTKCNKSFKAQSTRNAQALHDKEFPNCTGGYMSPFRGRGL